MAYCVQIERSGQKAGAVSQAKSDLTGWVCANVFDLWWSVRLLARMECATPSSYLSAQSWWTARCIRLGERRVRPLCHLMIRQQTWQENFC
jgi:hypothetical protein